MVDIQMLEKDKKTGRVTFLLKGSNIAFANSMRRNMLDTVPAMAVDEVEFRKNSSVLYDEIVAHRIGLIPLKTDLKSYTMKSTCKCKGEGCNRCTLKLTLKAKGPGIVYASDLKSKDPKVKPVYPELPIVKLLKGQELEFEATAILGQGKDHAKFSPCLPFYKAKPIIEIDEKKCNNAEACAQVCPVDVFEVKADKLKIKKENIMKCHLCMACADISSNGSVTIDKSENEFVFSIEPWGQLSPSEIASKAAEMFSESLNELNEKLK